MPNAKALQRQEYILNLLEKNGGVAAKELAKRLDVSVWTIRRDLSSLEARGALQRCYGGADPARSPENCQLTERDSFRSSSSVNADAKRRIGQAAVSLIQPRESLALGAGTTPLEVAKALRKSCFKGSIVTNALDIALELAEEPEIHVVCTGGDVQPRYHTMVGSVAERMIKQHFCDAAVIGISGVSIQHGLTVNSQIDAATLELMMKQSCRTILVVDSAKFGRVSFAAFNPPVPIDYLVTDSTLPPAYTEYLRALNIKLVIAE